MIFANYFRPSSKLHGGAIGMHKILNEVIGKQKPTENRKLIALFESLIVAFKLTKSFCICRILRPMYC